MNAVDDDALHWLRDDDAPAPARRPPRAVLLVDDDDAVLMVSLLAFADLEVDGHPWRCSPRAPPRAHGPCWRAAPTSPWPCSTW
ncbi:MAG: hypothetical protein R3A48_27840 [Polyangiales bacterium]